MVPSDHYPAVVSTPEYEEIDIGEEDPIRCLKEGLWLFEHDGAHAVMYISQAQRYGEPVGMRVEVAAPQSSAAALTREIFADLEEAIRVARSYRGKVLSLEIVERYSGKAGGIRVHRLPSVSREAVILPQKTIDLLERNVVGFMRQRSRLSAMGLPTKKGLLFYGPPGTGKTHTISFLAGSLPDVTTLLITAEQVGNLDEYMTLARLLQPSMVVIEDADLIARNRETMNSSCEEVLLNKLLNEMDGLRENIDVFFILTTNRPESLESALSARPGRIDQAIEFPRPDVQCRRKLLELYGAGLRLTESLLVSTVSRTEGCSAAFLKELVRRSAQFSLERDGDGPLTQKDIEMALDELLFHGSSLNRAILGAGEQVMPAD
jgi:ATP-dependent 26S proteasome regulatory subunit